MHVDDVRCGRIKEGHRGLLAHGQWRVGGRRSWDAAHMPLKLIAEAPGLRELPLPYLGT